MEKQTRKNNWGCSPQWKTAPISPTCEVRDCARATDLAYPAAGGGWMALCLKHGLKHVRYGGAINLETLIKGGEKFGR